MINTINPIYNTNSINYLHTIMLKNNFWKISIYVTLWVVLISSVFSVMPSLWATTEVGTLIEYKDTFLKNSAGVVNVLTDIISLDANWNKNQALIANAWDVVLNTTNTPLQKFNLLGKANAQINGSNPFFQANQNAPKNPTVFAPFEMLWDTKNIQQWVPIFFISYFQDGNGSQEWGYTIFRITDNWGTFVNRMFLWQAKANATYQIPAKNKTYTYWFYQTQNKSNLFLSGGNLNMTPTWITWIVASASLPVGTYKVYVQNINKFWLKSDELLGGTLNIIPSSVWGSVVKVGTVTDYRNYTDYVVDPTKFWFANSDNMNIVVNLWWAAKVEYVNNSVVDSNAGAVDWANWKFSWIKLLEGTNYITINFRDASDKVINTVPLVVNVDTKAPTVYDLSINEADYIGKKTLDNQINMLKYNGITHINDQLSKDWTETLADNIPVYMEYLDNNLKNVKIYYGSSEWSVNTLVAWYTWSWYVNGKKWVKFNIPETANADTLDRKYFSIQDWFGNASVPKALDFELNRTVNTPIVITNGGSDFSIRDATIDLKLWVDKDVNRIDLNWKVYPTSWNTEITLYGVLLVEGENVFNIKAYDVLDNISAVKSFKIIRNPALPEWLAWSDSQLKINGNVNAQDINFNRVTPDGSAGEVIQGSQ